jgi:hypothetical protein
MDHLYIVREDAFEELSDKANFKDLVEDRMQLENKGGAFFDKN